MLVELLEVVAVVGSGVTAGVLFAVALAVLPALIAMPAEQYVHAHRLIGRHWDPTMPVIVLTTAVADVLLAVLAPSSAGLFAIAAALVLGVSVVSHFCNVPINRAVHGFAVDGLPEGWQDPRPRWRRWHLLRTVLAVLAVAVNAFGVVGAR
ncbi:DUF1772 domain-containing protein [Actinosynnema sp. CS-041913]|uniref:anthrone oxygenase family protein n=1 Tax=Actinosynnema sp. CS-041913 TaxID=3239917 RepID=UPI003D912E5C